MPKGLVVRFCPWSDPGEVFDLVECWGLLAKINVYLPTAGSNVGQVISFMINQSFILLPCHSLEDFPVYHTGDDAASILANWTALWNPHLIAMTRGTPQWHRADEPPENSNNAIVLVPMFPHTLSSRPIVVDGKSEIKLVIGETNETYPQISFDGQMNIACAPGDIIRITKKPFKIRLIHPTDHNFYATCRDKLGWASEISAS